MSKRKVDKEREESCVHAAGGQKHLSFADQGWLCSLRSWEPRRLLRGNPPTRTEGSMHVRDNYGTFFSLF